MKLGAKSFKHLLPVLVGGEAATGREADHMARVKLSVKLSVLGSYKEV
jgi:hypothetical protein